MSLRIVELFTKDGEHFKVGDPRPVVDEDVVSTIDYHKLDAFGYRGPCYVVTFGETPLRETIPADMMARYIAIEEKETDEADLIDTGKGKVKN
jgi:hypothetical protein